MKRPRFTWNEENGEALCVIQDKNKIYYGTATCHQNDRDMMSEKTGCEIAFLRANLMALRNYRDELQIELKGLKKYYYSINRSKYFNEKSYEVQRLQAHMQMLKDDLNSLKELIEEERQYLINYLKGKGEFYKKIRQNREKNQKLDETK